jgi:hypothetical protein
MTRFRAAATVLLALGLVAATAAASYAAGSGDDSDDRRITLRDDCDPKDPAWANLGGCARKRGNVSVDEFDAELDSPLAAAVVGHQAWRIDPSYLVIKEGTTVRVKNAGGRPHTFTGVAAFGGGMVPPLNEGLVVAPECPGATVIPPGGNARVSDLAVGNHRFQCCIHPWQRALIKVKRDNEHHQDDDD